MKVPGIDAHQWILSSALLVMLESWLISFPASATEDAAQRGSLEVICAPDTPVAHIGESITVRAWAVVASGQRVPTPISWAWSTSIGTVKGRDIAVWSFWPEDAPAGKSTIGTATATATARSDRRGQATCALTITLVRPIDSSADGIRGVIRGVKRLSGRTFLLPKEHEPKGYGLHSYLMFYSPPTNDKERTRYLGAIASYLQLIQPISEMENYRRRSQLNLTVVPVKQPVVLPDNLSDPKQAARAAEQVLAVYDYARAQSLLADLGPNGVRNGPYLVSTMPSESGEKGVLLQFDMSRVEPSLVPDWLRIFMALTTQESSWSEITLNKLALNTRNVLAVMARDTPEVVSALTGWIKVLK